MLLEERNPAEVDRWASDLIELATRHNFALHLATGSINRGWVRSVSGDTAEGISLIEDGIRECRAIGPIIGLPFFLSRKADALHVAGRTSEALEAIDEAEAFVERTEARWWCIELHRLRGVFLTAIGAEEGKIEASFCEAIRIAKEQKAVSLQQQATQNTVAKKSAVREDVDCDYLFASFLQNAGFGSIGKADPNIRVRPIRERPFSLTVLEIHWLAHQTLAYTITRKSENTSRRSTQNGCGS